VHRRDTRRTLLRELALIVDAGFFCLPFYFVFATALRSLGAYAIARRRSRFSDFVYILFVLGIILPFQLAIIPLYVAMGHLGSSATTPG
jgi:ABC-type glycerol-3-phosphate transport system permease component